MKGNQGRTQDFFRRTGCNGISGRHRIVLGEMIGNQGRSQDFVDVLDRRESGADTGFSEMEWKGIRGGHRIF